MVSTSWAKGRLALVGDAAAALPPTLGLGASMGLTNAYNLVTALDVPGASVPSALTAWDSRCRPIAQRVQRRAGLYNALTGPLASWARTNAQYPLAGAPGPLDSPASIPAGRAVALE